MNTATITPNYFSVSPILFSAVEKTVASGLLNEISRAASKIKSENIKTIEEQLLFLSPFDKLTCLKKHYGSYTEKASQYPGLNFNSTNLFDPNYYTHRINSVVKDRLKKFNLTLNLSAKNDDQRLMMEFVNMYNTLILSIYGVIEEFTSNAECERKYNKPGKLLSFQLSEIIASIPEYEDFYNSIGYRFGENHDEIIDESFMFLSKVLRKEIEIYEKKDFKSFHLMMQSTQNKLTDLLSTLKKCSEELLEEIKSNISSTLIKVNEKEDMQEALAISDLLDYINQKIATLEEKSGIVKSENFTLHANIEFMEGLHKIFYGIGKIPADKSIFINLFTKDKSEKLNWTGTYQELWCFLQIMFIVAIENPYFKFSKIDDWEGYVNVSLKTRIEFSGWLNDILYNRIKVKGGIFDTDKMKDIKNKQITKQIKIRQDFFKLIFPK